MYVKLYGLNNTKLCHFCRY